MAINVVDFVMTLPGKKKAPGTVRGNNRLVLIVLATYADKDGGRIFPGLKTLADETAVSRNQLRRILAKLQALGYLVEIAPPRQHRAREYRIPLKSRGPIAMAPLNPGSRGPISASRGPISDVRGPIAMGSDPLIDPLIDPSTRTRARGACREAFECFWDAYPRKEKQADAWQEWQRVDPDAVLLATIIAALAWQITKPSWLRRDGQFIPEPANWLRKHRWTDEPSTTPHMSEGTANLARVTKAFLDHHDD